LEYKNSIIEQIGNTPLIKLNKINRGLKPQIFAKLESANPGGSVKDGNAFSGNLVFEFSELIYFLQD